MRVYGRVTNSDGAKTWVVVTTDANGYNDAVNLTWLAQVLKLNTGESPFYGAWGIPQYQTIVTQVFPDYYVMKTQQQFAGMFAYLSIARASNSGSAPVYNVAVTTHAGSIIATSIPADWTADSMNVNAGSSSYSASGSTIPPTQAVPT